MNAQVGNRISRLIVLGPAALWAMVGGGILWILHGYFRFLTPQGPDVEWREELGYSSILSNGLFLLYNLPRVMALLLTAWAALSFLQALRAGYTGLKRAAQVLVLLASAGCSPCHCVRRCSRWYSCLRRSGPRLLPALVHAGLFSHSVCATCRSGRGLGGSGLASSSEDEKLSRHRPASPGPPAGSGRWGSDGVGSPDDRVDFDVVFQERH